MKYCVLDKRASAEIRAYLRETGFQVVLTCELPGLQPPLSTHTDIQIVKVGERLICAPCLFSYYREFFPDVIPGNTELFPTYPLDVAYNCLVMGKKLFHRTDITDPVVLSEARRQGFSLIPVQQGYTACSTLAVTENAAITADAGMAKALLKQGVDVCLIESGGVKLSGFPYGFIGGAGGRISESEILFFGALQEKTVYSFLQKYRKTPIAVPGLLEDFGGLLVWESEKIRKNNKNEKIF